MRDIDDGGDGWQQMPPMRPPPASAGRVGNAPSADDRRTEMIRGFNGQVPREVLPDLAAPFWSA